jgi:Bacterial self-protective colicin-like immunity
VAVRPAVGTLRPTWVALRDFALSRHKQQPVHETPWADRQLEVARLFVRGDLDARDFIGELLSARHESVTADEFMAGDFSVLLNDFWFAIDMHNEYDELREPDEFDDAQLREVLTRYLADWDAGPGA